MYRVAITGIGIISCIGNNIQQVADSLRKGKSGIVVDDNRIHLGFRSPLTGIIQHFNPTDYLTRKHRKTMTTFTIQTYAAVKQALYMAALNEEEIENKDTGLIFGCDSSCISAVEQVELLRKFGETKSIGSGLVFRSMNSNITMNLNTILKTKGACWTISSACSSGGHAIGQAADIIALGRQHRVICGGAQEINWESMCSFDALGAFYPLWVLLGLFALNTLRPIGFRLGVLANVVRVCFYLSGFGHFNSPSRLLYGQRLPSIFQLIF